MSGFRRVALALFLGLALFPRLAASQPPTRPPNMIETLNKEAEASDPAGIRAYSEHLALLLPIGGSGSTGAAGSTYLSSFSDRLAKAEESARQGKRKLISEEAIAGAFNDLMRQTAAPSSFRADVADVVLVSEKTPSPITAIAVDANLHIAYLTMPDSSVVLTVPLPGTD